MVRDPSGLRKCAQVLVTGTTFDPVRHMALHLYDSNTGKGAVFSHGGQASGINSLAGYLGSYNSEIDPTAFYQLDITDAEARELEEQLFTDFRGPRFPRYNEFTNNCAQYSKEKILEVVNLSLLEKFLGKAGDLSIGYDMTTNQVLDSLMNYGLIGGECN